MIKIPSIEKLPSGNWRAKVFVERDRNGKKIFKSFTAETKKQAEYMAAEFAMKTKAHQVSAGKMTVGEAINKYIELKENILSPTTIGKYKCIRRNDLQGLMNIKLEQLTQEDVQREINLECRRISAKSISSAHGLLSASLAVFYPDFRLRTTLPRIQKKIKQLPEPEEIMKIFKGSEIELPVLMGLMLGMRMSEIRGVRWKDIKGNILTIQNIIVTVDGKNIAKAKTKTNQSTRQLHIPDEIMQLLIKQSKTEEYVIKLSGQAIYKRFVRRIEKTGLPKMTFHDLRHINASVMLKLGIPDKYAMERGGWSTNSTLKSVYQHTFSTERQSVDEKIEEYFSKISKENGK